MRPVLSACVAVALWGCSDVRAGPTSDPLTGVAWRLADLNARGVLAGSRITLRFGDDGRASGLGGCNRWSGDWRRQGSVLAITRLGSTRTACDAALVHQEDVFLSALQEADGYRLIDDRVLLVTTRDGRQLTFEPVTD
ncbi:META domain-containing protein [Caulobacter sp. 17J80-11]|uniref:META domain-containing protein n=1 Tax=Caulobacter sp. 17J80-11 TaxID=2763502 RepID=UPI001653C763|nr:META domain-containing protein [Caulobacter sp. 17J80-11]MBC6980231.1 META domain-containing protein [Caulobacter sp. 17J80-11]